MTTSISEQVFFFQVLSKCNPLPHPQLYTQQYFLSYIGEVAGIFVRSAHVAASRAYYCVTKPALKRESSHWVPITEQRSNILEPRVCPHEKCKTQHYKALCLHTLLSIMSNIHCIDTKWGKKTTTKMKNKQKNKQKQKEWR